MSTHSRNWVKLTAAVAFAFMLAVFFARLFDLPAVGLAQDGKTTTIQRAAITPVSAPRLANDPRILSDLSDAYAAVTAAVRPSVVFITADQPEMQTQIVSQWPRGTPLPPGFGGGEDQPGLSSRSIGSGFIVSNDGYIVTNNHVIEGATKVQVRLLDDRVYTATVVGTDKNTDIGVLKIDAKGLTPAALGSSEKVRVGEWVLAIGNPLGNDLTFSVTQGIVSAKGRAPAEMSHTNYEIHDFIQTDAVINQGNSGGPLLNVRGEVVGINTAIASTNGSYQGYALAIPIDLASQVMNQIITHGKFDRSVLQINVGNATAEDAAYLGLPEIGGVLVTMFPNDNSPAKQAGLQVGDVIVAVDGRPVKYVGQLQQIVGFHRPGDMLKVEVARKSGRKEFSVKAVAADIPDDDPKPAFTPRPTAPPIAATNKLGVVVERMTPSLAQQLQYPVTIQGLYITNFADGAPAAEKLASKATDGVGLILTEVEGKAVRSEEELRSALSEARNGVVTVMALYPRGGVNRTKPIPVRIRLMP